MIKVNDDALNSNIVIVIFELISAVYGKKEETQYLVKMRFILIKYKYM